MREVVGWNFRDRKQSLLTTEIVNSQLDAQLMDKEDEHVSANDRSPADNANVAV